MGMLGWSKRSVAVVLVVGEDAAMLHTAREYLSRAGFVVLAAANGWEALKTLQSNQVDAVIVEDQVADMDGCSLREKCMLRPETRDVPFVFVAPEVNSDSALRALRAGVDDVIAKPFDPVVLVARLQAMLERRRHYERMVRVDPLTRLLNRPTLEDDLQLELARVKRYDRHGSIVVIDVNDFGEVNRESGYALGDLMLTCLSGVILTCIRNVDTAGRLRGDKFVLYLPETGLEGARILAARMQERLSAIADSVAGFAMTFTAMLLTVDKETSDWDEILRIIESRIAASTSEDHGKILVLEPIETN